MNTKKVHREVIADMHVSFKRAGLVGGWNIYLHESSEAAAGNICVASAWTAGKKSDALDEAAVMVAK